MAKTNITFNDKNYSIEESVLAPAAAELKSHLSTAMSGTGAVINLDGVDYNVDATKLSTAMNSFVTHLGTIAGNGAKIIVNGVEYFVDSSKISNAISDFEANLSDLGEERLEGDGGEYYTLAPTPLSFRSTAPLNELQDVQINGVTVDPANYTLEEGSTIVTFSIDYLKTLNVGNYEVNVVSDSKSVKGGFTVAAPELNEYGFYYNQPYTAYVAAFGENESVFIREDGTLDIIGTPSGFVSSATYSISGNTITVVSSIAGTLTGTISADSIFINELATNFMLTNDTSIAADNDYIYIYKEDLGGYEVKCIDKTKSEYGAIKTGINGIDTVKLGDEMFVIYIAGGALGYNSYLMRVPQIPKSVTIIGDSAFFGCRNLTTIDIPDNITSIGNSAFSNCESLKSITIPDSVTEIGHSAFYGCESLKSITIPDGVTNISNSMFSHCYGLTSITFGENSQLTSIDTEAFLYCADLTSIEIPDSVTEIGNSTFSNCESLKSIIIPESVTDMGSYVFNNTYTQVYFNTEKSGWADNWFSGGKGQYHDGVQLWVDEIAYGMTEDALSYYVCGSIKKDIVIPSTINDLLVTSIDDNAFCNCTSLENIIIPDSITSIGHGAFENCSSLTNITIPDSVTSIGNGAFYNCTSLENIIISDSVTSIGNGTFHNCSSLTNITIPDSVTSIGNGAFYNCTSLTNITIPDSVTSIDNMAFDSCSSLTSITIPNSVTSIGNEAFDYCSSLTSITFNGTVAQWNAIEKDVHWDSNIPATHVHCSDGDVAL